MDEPIIKELTTGKLKIGWLKYCYMASLSPDGFYVKGIGLIPRKDIQKLSSEPLPWWYLAGKGCLRCLKVTHQNPTMQRDMRFLSTRWKEWFSAFESLRVPTEDLLELRNADTAYLKASKGINLAAGAIGVIVAVGAVVVGIIAFVKVVILKQQ